MISTCPTVRRTSRVLAMAIACAVLARATIQLVTVSLRRPFHAASLDRQSGEVWPQ